MGLGGMEAKTTWLTGHILRYTNLYEWYTAYLRIRTSNYHTWKCKLEPGELYASPFGALSPGSAF